MTDQRTPEPYETPEPHDEEPELDGPAKWAQKIHERREAYAQRSPIYRVGFTIAGALVTLAGVVMLVTPGPAFVLIPIGLAMLAMEFAWAERLLNKALIQADKAGERAKDASPAQKILTALAVVLVIAAVIGAIFYWDITVPILNPKN